MKNQWKCSAMGFCWFQVPSGLWHFFLRVGSGARKVLLGETWKGSDENSVLLKVIFYF